MAERVQITGPTGERYVEILSPKALELLVLLHDALADRRAELLAARRSRQARLSGGRCSTSCRRPPTSARTPRGGSRRRPPGWSTAGSRSPARPTAR